MQFEKKSLIFFRNTNPSEVQISSIPCSIHEELFFLASIIVQAKQQARQQWNKYCGMAMHMDNGKYCPNITLSLNTLQL